jgi:hypothetical protein
VDHLSIDGAKHSVTECRHSTNVWVCCLNIDLYTAVITHFSVIMCNMYGVSRGMHVVL